VSEEVARDPLSIWKQVDKTDPKYTKRVTYGARQYTAIDPQYQLLQATKLWGPYGFDWGIRDARYTTFAYEQDVKVKGQVEKVRKVVTTMMLECTFYYPVGGTGIAFDEGNIPIAVDQEFEAGDDCCKKLMTNARSKALSTLGFASDVFMGKFDDERYVKEMDTKFGDFEVVAGKALVAIKKATTKTELDKFQVRVDEFIQNDTVPELVWRDLVLAIQERRLELGN
jgi:hypothetical protein